MPRKKPFSAKQKKKQLQDRRRRKQDADPDAKEDSAESEEEKSEEDQETSKATVAKINQQPARNFPSGRYDPNRYRLHFFQESKEELAKRKEKAHQPYKLLPQESLEMWVDVSEGAVIDFPKRPAWDYSLSKQQLEHNEERYFKTYIESLFGRYAPNELSFFELNLETWRQLWRVIEMSDMFLLITDIRHPLLHFSPALYQHLTQDLQKHVVLVLNKVDLAPPSLVVAWQQFFREKFPLLKTVSFTSFPKSKCELENVSGKLGKVMFKKRRRGTYRAMGPQELYKVCESIVRDEVDLSSWASKIESDQDIDMDIDHSDGEEEGGGGARHEAGDPDCSFHKHERFKDGLLTIGCIGYPNVGKSSVMNGLMGKKVVSVSRTPGHTKHFQTIFLTPTVRLCDSPGLVFPSRGDKNLQILGGLYPVAQVREPYSTIGYLAERMDLPHLLKLKPVDDDVPVNDVKWTARDICDAWAEKRGFLTAKAARLDTYRAANNLLRLAVDGRICLCHTPPGYFKDRDKFESHQETREFIDLQHKYRLGDKRSHDSESDLEEESESEDEEEMEGEKSMSAQAGTKPTAVKTVNPFALLADNKFESHQETKEFIDLQHKYRLGDKGSHDTESDLEEESESEHDEEMEGEKSMSAEAGTKPTAVKTVNPFALLADSD